MLITSRSKRVKRFLEQHLYTFSTHKDKQHEGIMAHFSERVTFSRHP